MSPYGLHRQDETAQRRQQAHHLLETRLKELNKEQHYISPGEVCTATVHYRSRTSFSNKVINFQHCITPSASREKQTILNMHYEINLSSKSIHFHWNTNKLEASNSIATANRIL